MWVAAIKMIGAMAIGLAILYFAVRFAKQVGLGRGPGSADVGIRVLTSKAIAPQKYVSLVEIGGEVLALGISPQQVTFLTRIENKEKIKEILPGSPVKPEPLSWFRVWPMGNKRIKNGISGLGNGK
jgi:flagellar biogenesis protein FliO